MSFTVDGSLEELKELKVDLYLCKLQLLPKSGIVFMQVFHSLCFIRRAEELKVVFGSQCCTIKV